jgi:hypothetical protein
MLQYADIEKKSLRVIKNFFNMNHKSKNDVLALTLNSLGLTGSSNMYDPLARIRGLCQELKTAFLQASDKLPPLHLDIEPSTFTDHLNWTIDQLIDQHISDALHSLTKEDVV